MGGRIILMMLMRMLENKNKRKIGLVFADAGSIF